ncbi:hypothetical protein FOE78_14445 [Microlunatus elymi]|uniref:DUF2567 domain-containing protein n=1 Tax=Microlunatus elymi TaxID=2596828 RepID=A0A516Q0L4_9ACTN|nr:hypothetical protein [Microlunatus elymi]QDP96957.1 hypothetical protein FOE78_14445 [Microlunatus elymi]
MAEPEVVQPPTVGLPGRPEISVSRAAGWLAGYLLLCLLVGVGAGALWEKIVRLPTYTVAANGTASTTERGLTEFFGSDAWFCVLGFLISIGLGIVCWKWFGKLGWPVVVVAILGAVCAGLVCWYIGYQLGPGDFERRLATAGPGDVVPIALNLRSPVALVVWAFGAIIPVLLRSSLGKDEEEAALPPRRRTRRR